MWFLTDPWWRNHKIRPTFGQVIFLVQCRFPGPNARSHPALSIMLCIDCSPTRYNAKRNIFNIANLGALAKSMVTKSTKENVSSCIEILKKLLTFRRLTPLDQHHPARRRRICYQHSRASLSSVCKGLQLDHVSLQMLTNMVLQESKLYGP